MTYIPISEISVPGTHADEIGYVFIWEGHLLRGIFHSHESQARNYFNSGFVDEITSKGLFPKSWISDFCNEQFVFIIEHEMISPVIYAQEWNQSMLKDAALMVVEIAKIGWKYGYNMVDCHKTNVLFRNNKPMYVDLGSFVPIENGCTGWRPYKSFLESYTYILDLWTHGLPQMAKRMMSTGVILQSKDYYSYKYPVYRKIPKILDFRLRLKDLSASLAILSEEHFTKRGLFWRFIKKIFNSIRVLPSQNLNRLKKRLSRMTVKDGLLNESKLSITEHSFWKYIVEEYRKIMIINCNKQLIFSYLQNGGG